jgi:hypothetical protein
MYPLEINLSNPDWRVTIQGQVISSIFHSKIKSSNNSNYQSKGPWDFDFMETIITYFAHVGDLELLEECAETIHKALLTTLFEIKQEIAHQENRVPESTEKMAAALEETMKTALEILKNSLEDKKRQGVTEESLPTAKRSRYD